MQNINKQFLQNKEHGWKKLLQYLVYLNFNHDLKKTDSMKYIYIIHWIQILKFHELTHDFIQ